MRPDARSSWSTSASRPSRRPDACARGAFRPGRGASASTGPSAAVLLQAWLDHSPARCPRTGAVAMKGGSAKPPGGSIRPPPSKGRSARPSRASMRPRSADPPERAKANPPTRPAAARRGCSLFTSFRAGRLRVALFAGLYLGLVVRLRHFGRAGDAGARSISIGPRVSAPTRLPSDSTRPGS